MKRSAGISGSESGLSSALRRRFSLTPSEARIALLVAEGLTYAEIANRLGVSYHTVHTHIKEIHRKANVSSNGRLLAVIQSLKGV